MTNPLLDEYAYLNEIPCATEAYVQIITPIQSIRLKTRLIGVDPHMSIILANGNDNGWIAARESIREGQKLIVRLVNGEQSDAHIIAFKTQVQKTMSFTGHWLLVDYPKEIQRVALRSHSRLPTNIDALLLDPKTRKICRKGVLTDISINGGAFVGEPLQGNVIDKEFILKVKLANEQEAQTSTVIVKNSKKLSNHDSLVQYGLNIMGSEDISKIFAEHLVLHTLLT